MARSKKSKSVLGQSTKKVEPKEEKEDIVIDGDKFVDEVLQTEIPFEESVVEVVVEEPEQPEQPIEVEEVVSDERKMEVVEAPALRKVADLSPKEYRSYLNTGKIPQ